MTILYDHFPVFEANQVLTSGHLNDVFDYLDQQERETRSYLIGIGIVCGLEIALSGSTISLSKGCGVTSEGYLIVEPEDLSLVAYRPYLLPPDIEYPPFKSGDNQYPLWELFEAGAPNTTPLGGPAGFLDDKAVLLFLELKKQGLRNCSPNNCDDKGSQVTTTVRRLLIVKSDLDKIIAAANALGSGLTASDIDSALSARLDLPDLRLHRFDVPNSDPVTSSDIYTAFLDMVRAGGLAHALSDALSATYTVFQPLVEASYSGNPFANFVTVYGFLDSAPTSAAQVTFLQYYADLFDDLLRGYDEFRWKGLELICACCPDDGLFPRHLMLGLLHPESVAGPDDYRQGFLASPAAGDCAAQTKDIVQLFTRLVEMTARFTNVPALPQANPDLRVDPQIRVTPSALGRDELAARAIPYYYKQDGAPPLYQLWSPQKTRRNRANQNLSYNADFYTNPPAPPFVTDPLRYDIEPWNWLRIEGHLGKGYQHVLSSLLELKTQYRLPIDVIALRTGAYDDSQPVDLAKESARFEDLESLYEALRGDLMSALAEGAMELYDRIIPDVAALTLNAGTPKLALLARHAPHYTYPANSVGSWYEHYLTRFETQGYIDVNQNAIDPTAVVNVYCALFNGTQPPDSGSYPPVVALYYISKLVGVLPLALQALDYGDFENKYQDLLALIRYFRSDAVKQIAPDLKNFLPEEEFIDFCEGILFSCKLDALKAVHDDYTARVSDIKKRQFLSTFLKDHPGIQHKAGAPLGGTFILVYHGEPDTTRKSGGLVANLGFIRQEFLLQAEPIADKAKAGAVPIAEMSVAAPAAGSGGADTALANYWETDAVLSRAIGNIAANRSLIANEDVNLLVNMLTGKLPITVAPQGGALADPAAGTIAAAVSKLENGTVIADFYLPYRVSCDGRGVQYVLPKPAPSFTVATACTAANGDASVTVNAKGGVPPYDVAVDRGAYQALSGALSLAAGDHTIMLRGADGVETPAQPVTIAPLLVIGDPNYACANSMYIGTAAIIGGTPPYKVNGEDAPNAIAVTDPTASGADISLTVMDSKGCIAIAKFSHTCPPPCTLPCAGIALNRGFKFWIPEAGDPETDPQDLYQISSIKVASFTADSAPGKPVDLSAGAAKVLTAPNTRLSAASFPALVNRWIKNLNALIAKTPGLVQAGKAQWLTFAYAAAGPGKLGTLSIEYFECLTFNLQLDVEYVAGPSKTKKTLNVAYTPDGTSIKMGDSTVKIPAFDGSKTDKCSETPVLTNLCAAPPAFTVQIQNPTSRGMSVAATATVTGSIENPQFLWEVQDGTPPMANGQPFSAQFSTSGSKLISVTVYDKNGCSAMASHMVSVG
jgi:hypothetical protein